MTNESKKREYVTQVRSSKQVHAVRIHNYSTILAVNMSNKLSD